MLQGGQSPDGVADVLRREAGKLLQGVPAQHIQEGRRGAVSQRCICPDHVGHTLGLEAADEGVAVPCCSIHELCVKLACTQHGQGMSFVPCCSVHELCVKLACTAHGQGMLFVPPTEHLFCASYGAFLFVSLGEHLVLCILLRML